MATTQLTKPQTHYPLIELNIPGAIHLASASR